MGGVLDVEEYEKEMNEKFGDAKLDSAVVGILEKGKKISDPSLLKKIVDEENKENSGEIEFAASIK